MVWDVVFAFFGTILFFIPGVLASYLIFSRFSYLERIASSIALSSGISTFLGIILASFGWLTPVAAFWALGVISLVLSITLVLIKKSRETSGKEGFYLWILFSLIGTLWRILIMRTSENFGDAYGYVGHIISSSLEQTGSIAVTVPNLHFYSGMVGGHVPYLGGEVAGVLWKYLSFGISSFEIFLGMLLYLGFVFMVAKRYSSKKEIHYLCLAVLALGPVELWHSTLSFFGHPLSYIAVFSMLILFREGKNSYFFMAMIICSAATLSYYTAAMAVIVLATGFLIAVISEKFLRYGVKLSSIYKGLSDVRFYMFLLILAFPLFYVFVWSGAVWYTSQNIRAAASVVMPIMLAETTMPFPIYHYTGPFKLLGIPLIAFEDIIILLCGLTFVYSLFFGKNECEDGWIALACIPVLLLSISFIVVSSPERVFYYFSFFAILSLRVSKRFFVYVAIFLLLSTASFNILRLYERPYHSISDSEIDAAKFIQNNIKGLVFTDQHFANVLFKQGYYDVQGMSDNSPLNFPIYYENNYEDSHHALVLLDAEYIAITKRMREIYILDLNLPQEAMSNSDMYEKNYNKVYDNGDVRIYEVYPLCE